MFQQYFLELYLIGLDKFKLICYNDDISDREFNKEKKMKTRIEMMNDELAMVSNIEYREHLEAEEKFMRKQFAKIGMEMPDDYFAPLPPINPSIVW